MKVQRAELSALSAELDVPAEGGRRRWTSRRALRLRLHVDGQVGLGDAAPLPGYSRDAFEDTERALADFCVASIELSAELSLEQAIARCLKVIPETLPAARFAAETALLDLHSRLNGVPIHVLLGGAAEAAPRVAALVAAGDLEATLTSARRACAEGAAALKLKLQDARDWTRVEALRSELREVPLRIDFNRGLAADEVPTALARARSLGVELVEEPGPEGASPAPLAEGCPIFLDESLADASTRESLPHWLREGRVAGAVLKPAVLGGSLPCLDLARRVRAAGGEVFVTHLFDGPVALAAAAELALVLGARHAHGLGPHPALSLGGSFRAFAIDGYHLTPHREPGLGVGGEP